MYIANNSSYFKVVQIHFIYLVVFKIRKRRQKENIFAHFLKSWIAVFLKSVFYQHCFKLSNVVYTTIFVLPVKELTIFILYTYECTSEYVCI